METRHRRILRALDHLRADTTDQTPEVRAFGPREYIDPGVAEREREAVFGRVPSIVCHASEVPCGPLELPRHTVRVERVAGTVRITAAGGVELPAQERHGFVWYVDEPGAEIDVAAWLGPEMDGILAGYGMDELVAARSGGFDEPVNWKIMQDAFLDGYHIQYAHPNTAAKYVHTNVLAVEDFGRHVRFVSPRKSIDRYLEEPPGADEDLARHVTESHLLLPNSTLLRMHDHYQLLTFRPHPTDPGRCRMEMRVVVPTVERSGLSPERWEALWDKNWEILLAVLHEEDFPLLRGSQRAMASANAGGMVLGRNEVVNQIFHRELAKLTS